MQSSVNTRIRRCAASSSRHHHGYHMLLRQVFKGVSTWCYPELPNSQGLFLFLTQSPSLDHVAHLWSTHHHQWFPSHHCYSWAGCSNRRLVQEGEDTQVRIPCFNLYHPRSHLATVVPQKKTVISGQPASRHLYYVLAKWVNSCNQSGAPIFTNELMNLGDIFTIGSITASNIV